jgi:hypothetical protein
MMTLAIAFAVPAAVARCADLDGKALEAIEGKEMRNYQYRLRRFTILEAPPALSIMESRRYDVGVLQILPGQSAEFNAGILTSIRGFVGAADRVGTRLMLYVFNPLSKMEDASRTELLKLARERNILIVPFGEARVALHAEWAKSPVPLSLRGVGVHQGFHPAYLDVCMHHIAWTGKSPVDHPLPALVSQDVRVDAVRARFLQEMAWKALQKAAAEYGLKPRGAEGAE